MLPACFYEVAVNMNGSLDGACPSWWPTPYGADLGLVLGPEPVNFLGAADCP